MSRGDAGGGGLAPEVLFVYGCPRSGTTWVQLLLDRHPAVVTAPETHVFSFYLDSFRRQWGRETAGSSEGRGNTGLSQLLDREEFDDLCRRTAARVLEVIARRDPGATLVVEKSPQHACQSEWIAGLFPEARFLHVIRDPRDTVASLLAAGRGWGRSWAPSNPVDAARYWNRHVGKGRRIRDLDSRYREVRFEALGDDAAGELTEILSWLGLPGDEAFCRESAEACRLERLRSKEDGELPVPGSRTPDGFFRKGRVGGWREELPSGTARVVERICAPLMDELGYEREYASTAGAAVRIALHDGVQRCRESLDWQVQRLLRRL